VHEEDLLSYAKSLDAKVVLYSSLPLHDALNLMILKDDEYVTVEQILQECRPQISTIDCDGIIGACMQLASHYFERRAVLKSGVNIVGVFTDYTDSLESHIASGNTADMSKGRVESAQRPDTCEFSQLLSRLLLVC
jgi:hypothetical protein